MNSVAIGRGQTSEPLRVYIDLDEDAVAAAIEEIHKGICVPINYNDALKNYFGGLHYP